MPNFVENNDLRLVRVVYGEVSRGKPWLGQVR